MKNSIRTLLLGMLIVGVARHVVAQGTAFTYQGQLQNNGSPANGSYNLTFSLYTNSTAGALVEGPVTNNSVGVTNGLFTVLVDFGPGAFTGATNWLQIGVESNGGPNFMPLLPRQPLTPSPSAIFATTAGNLLGPVPSADISGTYGNSVTFLNGGDSFYGTFSGTGTGLTGLNAAQVKYGFLPSSVLPGFQTPYSTIDGGLGNGIQGEFSTIGGGLNNQIYADYNNFGTSVIAGGDGDIIYSNSWNSFIGGGENNTIAANSDHSTIGGGWSLAIGQHDYEATITGGYQISIFNNAAYSAIGGGLLNQIYGDSNNFGTSVIAGGDGDIIYTNSWNSVIGGGQQNTISNAHHSFIGGGQQNTIGAGSDHSTIGGGGAVVIGQNDYYSAIAGGYGNTILSNAPYSAIGGGINNQISGDYYNYGASVIAGGDANIIYSNSWDSVIVGGYGNTILSNAPFSAIGGGLNNQIYGDYNDYGTSVIAGGDANIIYSNSWNSAIVGGEGNSILSQAQISIIGGGLHNQISGDTNNFGNSVVGGGSNNVISSNSWNSSLVGGQANTISSNSPDSFLGGGESNLVSGQYAVIPGGFNNRVQGTGSFAAGVNAQATNNGAFVWADSQTNTFGSTTSNQFSIRAQNGVVIQAATNSTALEIRTGGAIKITGAGLETATPVFIHQATSANITVNYSVINNPLCNGNPNAILIVTQNWNLGVYNPNAIGVFYLGTNWAIFNENQAAMPVNSSYNVLVFKP